MCYLFKAAKLIKKLGMAKNNGVNFTAYRFHSCCLVYASHTVMPM